MYLPPPSPTPPGQNINYKKIELKTILPTQA